MVCNFFFSFLFFWLDQHCSTLTIKLSGGYLISYLNIVYFVYKSFGMELKDLKFLPVFLLVFSSKKPTVFSSSIYFVFQLTRLFNWARFLRDGKSPDNWLLLPLRESNLQLFGLISIWVSSKVSFGYLSAFLYLQSFACF